MSNKIFTNVEINVGDAGFGGEMFKATLKRGYNESLTDYVLRVTNKITAMTEDAIIGTELNQKPPKGQDETRPTPK